MKDLIKKTALAGLGAISMTKKKAKELADKLVEEGEMSESEAAEFVKDLAEKSEQKREELENKIEQKVKDVMKDWDIPSKADVDEIKEKLDQMNQEN